MVDEIFVGFPKATTAPRWKFWIVYIFGKTIHKDSGYVFKKWGNCIWVFGGK